MHVLLSLPSTLDPLQFAGQNLNKTERVQGSRSKYHLHNVWASEIEKCGCLSALACLTLTQKYCICLGDALYLHFYLYPIIYSIILAVF